MRSQCRPAKILIREFRSIKIENHLNSSLIICFIFWSLWRTLKAEKAHLVAQKCLLRLDERFIKFIKAAKKQVEAFCARCSLELLPVTGLEMERLEF